MVAGNKKWSALTAAGTLTGAEIFSVVQGGVNVQTTVTAIRGLTPFSVSLASFGGVGDGIVDNTSVFNTMVAYCLANGVRRAELGAGVFRFASAPAAITDKIELVGNGMSSTVLLRDYAAANTTAGLIQLNYPGSVLRGFAIKAATGSSGGSAISSLATSLVGRASGHVFEDLWITTDATDKWANPIYIDGSLLVTGAQGARDLSFRNVHVFGCSDTSVTLKSVVGCSWKGGGLYSAGGTGARSGGLLMNGVVGNESYYIDFDVPVINGKVTMADSIYCTVRAREVVGDIENAATVLGSGVEVGNHTGTMQTNMLGASWSVIAGVRRLYPSLTSFTIATDAIAITPATVIAVVDTEAAAASDNLSTITGGYVGQIITVMAANTARDVVAKDGTGNLKLGADRTLDNTEDTLVLQWNGTSWFELAFANNGA